MNSKLLQNEEISRADKYTSPTLIHPSEWLLPTPIVPGGLSSSYDLTPISSCSQEALSPSDNAYKPVDDNFVNWLQWESSRCLAADAIEGAISVVFDPTAPLYNDDWWPEAIGRVQYSGLDSCNFQGEVLSDGIEDPRETAMPAYQASPRQEGPASAAKPLPSLKCTLPDEISQASGSCEFNTQLRINSEYSKTPRKNPDRSLRKSTRPAPTTLAVLEPVSGATTDSSFRRKRNHSRAEKQYRTRLDTSFQNLLRALPLKVMEQSQIDSLHRPRKGNVGKGEVLELARRYIEALEERLSWFEEERKTGIGRLENFRGL
ncbi:hypothetical protein BKA65DRAFT_500267 [Rhexocercosporidium sp. MPI-PUGE-AT-0058]|nr:hypothetical protein BKA65DRAFT_500267 [Rhexocercosporidium sp. MPI-PUGE-AT-0058]